MNRRHWVIGTVALAAVLVGAKLIAAQLIRDARPGSGEWVSSVPYRGSEPGTVGVLIRGDGRVQVTGTPTPAMWWAVGGQELLLRGNRVEVLSGGQVVTELWVRCVRGELRLLDPAFPQQALVLRKFDPA